MDDAPLFPGYEPPPAEGLSADQRRTRRQAADIAAGRHPLTGGPLHLYASRNRDATAPKDDPFTCGSCWFRQVLPYHGGRYPKCLFGVENRTDTAAGKAPRLTDGAGSDVRAWWPACPDYSPSARVSGDAARYVPG